LRVPTECAHDLRVCVCCFKCCHVWSRPTSILIILGKCFLPIPTKTAIVKCYLHIEY
jgi:hypothetical protein